MTPGVIRGDAIIADGEGRFSVETVEVDPPAAGEVRVAIAAAGVCHTDHASLRWPGPLVMGHEGAGHVEAIGEGVAGLQIGQPVLLNWAIPCGRCFQCEHGAEALANVPTNSTSHSSATAVCTRAIRAGAASPSNGHSISARFRNTRWCARKR